MPFSLLFKLFCVVHVTQYPGPGAVHVLFTNFKGPLPLPALPFISAMFKWVPSWVVGGHVGHRGARPPSLETSGPKVPPPYEYSE